MSAAAATAKNQDLGLTVDPDSRAKLDQAVALLAEKKDQWARLPIRDRRAILRELIADFNRVAERFALASMAAKRLAPGSTGEEWVAGPYFVIRNLALLERALGEIEASGAPQIPGPVRTRPGGQVVAQIFPQTLYDRIFYPGMTAEVWMEPGVTRENLAQTQAVAYHDKSPKGRVCLVLGGGNVASIGPMDILYKLFVDNEVVICKIHPVNAYLGPLLAEGFQALIDWDALRLVDGGTAEGAYLCAHPQVDTIHITGSDKTVEAIVFGPGEEGQRRKSEGRPRLVKPISSELGNVSPVIIVPGPWSESDLDYQAESLAAMLTHNAGCNCNTARMLVLHRSWNLRADLLARFAAQLRAVPPRLAYYPGAHDRFAVFTAAHPEAQQIGSAAADELPWTLIPDLDPEAPEEIAFRSEAFCSLCGETAIAAASVPEFLTRAVAFANQRLWGTLNVTLLVHPASLADPAVQAAVEQAIADLRYGTVSVNNWAAVGYGLVITPWGAFPGHDLQDIQSGTGVVHNTLMFQRVQKSVVRSPFRMHPKPMWFPSHRTSAALGEKLTRFEAAPSPLKLPGIFWQALRG